MTDREKIISAIEKAKRQSQEYAQDCIIVPFKEADMILSMLKEQEKVTEYVIDEFQPTCKACGFRPFAGYIPTLEWMRERGYNFCPHCNRKVKWVERR